MVCVIRWLRKCLQKLGLVMLHNLFGINGKLYLPLQSRLLEWQKPLELCSSFIPDFEVKDNKFRLKAVVEIK